MERIVGKNVELNYETTKEFFDNRNKKKNLYHRYNYVIFQDNNPQLAIERDAYEKQKISPILKFNQKDKILDIGCGVGRWGDEILSKNINYTGIDYSKKLLEVAENALNIYKTKPLLLHGDFQHLIEILQNNNIPYKFDKILINGVLMYINDNELETCLKNIDKIANKHCKIYIKESMSTKKRLTLNNFYSEELEAEYGAIYRSIKEYDILFKNIFLDNYSIIEYGSMWPQKYTNRSETISYFYIFEKKL